MDVTKLIKNFHALLKSSLPFLRSAGVTVGDDEWDAFAELAFQVTVHSPIERKLGKPITGQYGAWPELTSQKYQINAKAEAGATALIGYARTAPGGLIEARYENGKNLLHPVDLIFREFSHPFKSTEDSEWLEYVLGEVLKTEQLDPKVRALICVPVERCRFTLEAIEFPESPGRPTLR